MANEIFRLNDDKYSLEYESAKLDFKEYPKLKAQVQSLHDEFSDWQVTPDNIKESKEVRAKLRKFSKAVNDKKIKVVKVIDEPVNNFKKQIKDLCTDVDETADIIDEQIKTYEDHARKDKHEQNLNRVHSILKEHGISDDAAFNHIKENYDKSWDNKSYSYPKFKKDVVKMISEWSEKANADKEVNKLIVDKASELRVMPDRYLDDWNNGKPLHQIFEDMRDERAYLNDLSKKQAETRKAEQADLAKHGNKVIDPETGEVKDKLYNFNLLFEDLDPAKMFQIASFLRDWSISTNKAQLNLSGTKEQVSQLSKFLKDNDISVKRVK